MKRRYLYVLLFGVPAMLASLIVSVLLFGIAAGALWLFVFGDSPWPSSTDKVLGTLFLLVSTVLWIAFISVAYLVGKQQEACAAFNTWHLVASMGITALLVLVVVLHQWSVGNIGATSAGQMCSAFCRGKGFAASGMPPGDTEENTCSCYDTQGREVMTIQMSDVSVAQGK
jgi:hypothetical protein